MASRVAFRLVAKNRDTKASAEYGQVWEDEFGRRNVAFVTAEQAAKSQGKKIAGTEVVNNPQKYFQNFYENAPKPAEGSDIEF